MIDESKYDYIGAATVSAFVCSLEFIKETKESGHWQHEFEPGWWEVSCITFDGNWKPMSRKKIDVDEETDAYLRMKYL